MSDTPDEPPTTTAATRPPGKPRFGRRAVVWGIIVVASVLGVISILVELPVLMAYGFAAYRGRASTAARRWSGDAQSPRRGRKQVGAGTGRSAQLASVIASVAKQSSDAWIAASPSVARNDEDG